jgi:hypothetical protein
MWSACVLRRRLGVCHDDGGELGSISLLQLRTRASYSIHLKYAEFQMTEYASMKMKPLQRMSLLTREELWLLEQLLNR